MRKLAQCPWKAIGGMQSPTAPGQVAKARVWRRSRYTVADGAHLWCSLGGTDVTANRVWSPIADCHTGIAIYGHFAKLTNVT